MIGAYFRDSTGLVVCIIPGCGWRTTLDPQQGLDDAESVQVATTLLTRHRETAHPYHQLQVQKCPLRGCGWEDSAWSTPGAPYRQDTHRLQRNWSKHMTNAHPTVRGPGTIQVVIRLCPYGVPSADGREIAAGAIQPLAEDGVPIVTAHGEIVGRVSELREEDGWAIAEGFLREDLISELDRTSLWCSGTLPVSFAVREVEPSPSDTPSGQPWRIQTSRLSEVRVTDHDVTVWEGTGMRALHPKPDTHPEPPLEGGNRNVDVFDAKLPDFKAATQSVDAALRPLRDAMEAWAQMLTPAIQALAEALAEHAKAVAVKPEPMVIKVEDIHPDFLAAVSPPSGRPEYWKNLYGSVPTPPVSRYTCTCDGMPVPHVPGGPSCLLRPRPGVEADHWLEGDDEVSTPLEDAKVTEDEAGLRVEGRLPRWREYVGQPPVPEGPEDWPRLPRDGKRAPTGCEVCEAPVDGNHPRGCPGA